MWQSILSASELVFKGSCYKVGDGFNINLWTDSWIPWLPEMAPIKKESCGNEEVRFTKVSDLIDVDSKN